MCASELTDRSANPNQRPSRNSLNPCFVESRSGTRESEPASWPYTSAWTRCVCRIRGRSRARYAATSPKAIGSTSARRRMASSGTSACPELSRELPGARLVLVEHEEAHLPPALAQIREELQQVRLRAGDARDLLGVEHDAVLHEIPAASRMPRAHDCTEWPSATRSRSLRPSAPRASGLSAASARTRSASAPGSQRVNR